MRLPILLCKIWYFNPMYQNYLFQVKILVLSEKGTLYLITDKQKCSKTVLSSVKQLKQAYELSGSPHKYCMEEVQMTLAKKIQKSYSGTMSVQILL